MNGLSPALVPPLLGWYDQGHRDLPWRTLPTPYRVWISEIMLQQTRVEAVRRYFDGWMDALPDIRALAEAEESVYMKLWEGLGYYSRVRNLHRAAVVLCQEYGGQLPADYDKLLSLPGIGEYTAGAIASIAYVPFPRWMETCCALPRGWITISHRSRMPGIKSRRANALPHGCPRIGRAISIRR